MPIEEILERLAREHGTTTEVVRSEMEAYLKELMDQEVSDEDGIYERIAVAWRGRNMDLAEFIGRLAQEMELEKGKEEALRAYFEN